MSENGKAFVITAASSGIGVAAATEITAQSRGGGPDGLVNVAGVGMVRAVEYAPQDDVREIFEINFFGLTSVGVNLAIPFGGIPEFE